MIGMLTSPGYPLARPLRNYLSGYGKTEEVQVFADGISLGLTFAAMVCLAFLILQVVVVALKQEHTPKSTPAEASK